MKLINILAISAVVCVWSGCGGGHSSSGGTTLPSISIDDVTLAEGNGNGTVAFVFTVTISTTPVFGRDISVNWVAADGTAEDENGDGDYNAASGILVFINGGPLAKQITITVNSDDASEADENFTVELSNPINADIADGQGVGTILTDDTVGISISDVVVSEGNAPGTVNCVFAVEVLSDPVAGFDISVDWATADGTAEDESGDNDYASGAGMLTFIHGGPLSQAVSVTVNGDLKIELNETFTVGLSGAVNGVIVKGTGAGTIFSDDGLSITDAVLAEGDGPGTSMLTFTVSLPGEPESGADVTVDWATVSGTAEDESGDGDYIAASGTLTFLNGGPISQTVDVAICGDTSIESDEAFTVVLSSAVNAVLIDAQGSGTITNDDWPHVTISDATVLEGNGTGTSLLIFIVSISDLPLPGLDVQISWVTADGIAGNQSSDGDYIEAGGILTFTSVGTLTRLISIVVNRDDKVELNETLFVDLAAPVNCVLDDDHGVGIIQNDDVAQLTISDVTKAEGDAPYVFLFTFTVAISRELGTSISVSVDWSTADSTAQDESGDNDYLSGSGTLLFTHGTPQFRTVSVIVNGDTVIEPSETFSVDLSNPINAQIADSQGIGTLLNDDYPVVSIGDASCVEGNSSDTTSLVFTVSVSEDPAAGSDVSVDWATADGIAEDETGNNDYLAGSGTLVFSHGGGLTQQVIVTVNGDDVCETEESLTVQIGNAVNGEITDGTGEGIIANDDGPIFRVDPTSDGGPEDGLTWPTAYHTIQAAVDAAELAAGGEVWVAAGVYTNGGGTGDVVLMKSGIYIYGGFEGYSSGTGSQETLLSERDFIANLTVCDGQSTATVVIRGASNAGLNGFTVRNGGSDINCEDCQPIIVNNCILENASCGFMNRTSKIFLMNSVCDSNGPTGGVVINTSSEAVIVKCIFINNTADNGSAIRLGSSTGLISECIFTNNTAEAIPGGGAIYSINSTIAIDASVFKGNVADISQGGGITISNSTAALTNCLFAGNYAEDYGGGISCGNVTGTITNCTIYGNSSVISGGGINISGLAPVIANTVIYNNTSMKNANVRNNASNPTFSYCDIGGSGGSLTWDASLGTDGGNNIDCDPLFVNGCGPDKVVGTDDDDFRLLAYSPCVDAGTSSGAPLTDAAGILRPQGEGWDMGAYEETELYSGTTVYVDDDATGGNNGTSWVDAFTSVQDAVAAARPMDEIWVAEGTYTAPVPGAAVIVLSMASNIDMYGGFAGTETTMAERGDPRNHPAVLDGEGICNTVVKGANGTLLDGFTITGGIADNWNPGPRGGGMINKGTAPIIRNCLFEGNQADAAGAAMYNWGDCRPLIQNCTFRNNSGIDTTFDDGGAIYNFGASLLVNGCIFENNSAQRGNGGAIASEESPGTIIDNCRFFNNSALRGGAVYLYLGTVYVNGSVFTGNRAQGSSTSKGGAIDTNAGSFYLTNSSFYGNTAIDEGGAIFVRYSTTSTLANSVFWGNTAGTYPNLSVDAGNPTITGCDIGGCGGSVAWNSAFGIDGGGNIDADPLFVDPNGTDNITGNKDDDLRLQAGSPCIDAGDNSAVPADTLDLDGDLNTSEPQPYDIDWNARFFDDPAMTDTGNGTAPIVDMGAYEYQ